MILLSQTWQLESTNGEAIVLTFDSFDVYHLFDNSCIQSDFHDDYVEINDGKSTQKYCGSSSSGYIYNSEGTPSPIIPGPFTSSGTTMTIKFHSSTGEVGNGFLAIICCSVSVTTDGK